MLIQPLREPAPLALRGPEIPGRTEPVLETGEWGINLAAAKGNFPLQGLKIHILPWSNMGKGDKAVLLFDGAQVDQHTINDDIEVGERVTVWVNPRHLTNGSHTLSYSVIRFNQAAESYTPPVKLFVKLELPGGQDLNPEAGEHSELYLYIDPALIADGVDKDSAAAGVAVTIKAKPGSISRLPYPNIAPRDVITLSWGGRRIRSAPVTQEQIDDPDAHPIVVQVTEADILQAGDSGPHGLAVTFTIHDLVNNAAEDWCTETRIVVDTGSSRLEAPLVEQANGNELDLDALGDDDLHLMVWAATDDFNLHDVVIMHIKGTTLEGEAIDVTVRQTIEKSPPRLVDVYLPNSAGRALGQTQAIFFYQLERGGSIIQRSKGRFINIIGDPVRLLAPIAEDAQNGALDPDLSEVRIRIPYDERINEGMGIKPKWLAIRADLTTYEPDLPHYSPDANEADDPAGFVIMVEGKHLKTAEGGTLDLSYNLLEDKDGEIISRASQHAALLNVGAPQFELVAPSVLGEADGMLEPNDLVNGLSKVTCPAPVANPTLPNDVVTWQLRDANGTLLFEDRKTLNALTAGRDVTFSLDADFVQEHFEGNRSKSLTVSYNILRANTGKFSYSNPLEFTVGQVEVPALTSVKGSPSGEEIPDGGTTVETALTLTGTASKGKQVEIFDGSGPSAQSKGIATADLETRVWSISISVPEGARRLYAQSLYHSSPTYSNVRHLTVAQMVPPTISSVKGLLNNEEIPHDTVTTEHSVILRGTASKGQQVEIFDGMTSMGILTVKASGDWTTSPILDLPVAEHSFTAKALYGAGESSAARTFTVTETVVPGITSVKGSSSDVEIPDGGTTVETTVILTGTASKGQQVEIFNGTTSMGRVTADMAGDWTTSLTNLPVAEYILTAVALYGLGAPSLAWKFNVSAVVPPAITSVRGSPSGEEIPDGGITIETTLTLTGTASKGQSIKILDGTTDKGDAVADPVTGIWTKILTGLSVAPHSFTAKALYGAGQTSAARTLTVTATTAPTITEAKDSKGVVIPQGGITVDTSVTLTGTASKGQSIKILDGTTDKGDAVADPVTGIWTKILTGLSVAPHSFTAKALYGTGQTSAARTLTVTATTAPTITEAKDSKGVVIPQGGITVDTNVTLTGTASKGQGVKILDGTTDKGDAVADPVTGIWTKILTGLSVAPYSFTARALYGTGASSAARTFTVAPPLSITTSTMVLEGPLLVPGPAPYTPRWDRTQYIPPGATDTRLATGGVPPYTYVSENPAICTVDASTGVVVSASNGSTNIVVTDAKGTQARYPVGCSGVYELLHGNQGGMAYDAAMSFVQDIPDARVFIPDDAADNRIKSVMYLSYQKTNSAIAVSWGSLAPASGDTEVFLSTQKVASWPPAAEVHGVKWQYETNRNRSYYPLAIRSKGIDELVRDFTDFTDENMNGWVKGPDVHPRDVELVSVEGDVRLQNHTSTNNSSGVYIQKTFSNLRPKALYRFSIKVVRYRGFYNIPRLSIRAAGSTVAGPLDITSMDSWMLLSGTFTPNSNQAVLDVYSHVASGYGNDYQIDDIEVVRA
ncbi:Ig-like domain repeat protein [Pseudomonas koreensis]|uniref:Ig-like domain repeat protein n=1 Tax=Pseudomonas koreensis TaxID=198620 RepID=UPI0012447FD9|nr:Ig-like domain repeat protein [Pseudomonas koreensis]KAB0510793.1 Ig-like domain repeat protein [Pseudomonas koreensis]